MFGIGGGELLFIIFIALMLFGTDKIPEFARTFGKFMANLKSTTNEIKYEIQKSAQTEDLTKSMSALTDSFTREVDEVKESVAPGGIIDLNENALLEDPLNPVKAIEEDIESLTGPIKRKR
jgi:sec-independent protein translocase protein TatA